MVTRIREQEKGIDTTAGRHNGIHSEARRTGDTALPRDMSGIFMY